ncbi:MAG TPA: RtcB family protein [Tepidisphaeraceae bacterium]|jgi:tRNA-splicing ligase RtcB|nr:RtcB family protein [Tepidisphaeraceae bacterium]
MKAKDLLKLGFKPGPTIGVALKVVPPAITALSKETVLNDLRALLTEPSAYKDHPHYALLAKALLDESASRSTYVERATPAPYQIWGANLEPTAIDQMKNAARLPIAVAGALMPDAHVGYGLPIGGVLATDNAVIPYAVGVDIACRMRLSIFPIPSTDINRLHSSLERILQHETVFGTGAEQKKPIDHEVLNEDWSLLPITKRLHPKARAQIGTSGSGNHFVEWGTLTLPDSSLSSILHPLSSSSPLPPGTYLALLSHSGSRGTGATIADFYSRLAMDQHPELPPELRRLAWLSLDSDAGQEYWHAMNLMGRYAHANHEIIHHKIQKALGEKPIATIENHHNFAWKEHHLGRDLIVHRKGATPAGPGVLGVIPGSMATPGFVVRGKGSAPSLHSASHGAGRTMSRTAAKEKFRWAHIRPLLESAGVTLLSAGIDEVPLAYKDIHSVMASQSDLVETLARFDPKIVKMADAGEKPED